MKIATGTQAMRLPDGRILSYAEYGDPNGTPVLFCHGHPGSRLQAHYLDETAAHLKARIIAPDRPGWGLSDFKFQQTLLDWTQDVVVLADYLQIDQLPVIGVSGGGSYVAACAYQLPERVSRAVFVMALGPMDVAGLSRRMSVENQFPFGAARFTPWLLPWIYRSMAETTKDLDTFVQQLAQSLPQVDVVAVQRENCGALLMADQNEAFHQGVQGAVRDTVLYTRP